MRDSLARLGIKISQMLQGKNGFDSPARACIIAGLVVSIVNMFFFGSTVLTVISYALLIYAIFRVFSPNSAKRRQEAEAFDQAVAGPNQKANLLYKKVKNRKTTCYFTCSNCKTVYSAPKGKGKIRVTCPHCHEQSIHTT